MSAGLQLIDAVLTSGGATSLNEIDRAWLLEDEQTTFDFVRAHWRHHGQLPDAATLRENGILTQRAREPVAYYIERIRRRYVFNTITEEHPRLLAAMESRDVEAAAAVLRELTHVANATQNVNSVTTLMEEAEQVMEEIRYRRRYHGLVGVTSGYPTVDEVMGGYQPGNVYVVVGRPNQGKSWSLLHSAVQAWSEQSVPLIVSMEMSVRQLSRRIMSMTAHVDPDQVATGQISTHSYTELLRSIAGFPDMPQFHFMAGDFRKTVGDVDAVCQQINPDIIYVDAAYLLSPERERRRGSRREYIADVIEELKGLAVDRNRPVVVTVQFNREIKPGRKRALDLSMIAETDAIGQIASGVLGLRQDNGAGAQTRRHMEIMKNRDGELRSFKTHFLFHPRLDFSEIRHRSDAVQPGAQGELEEGEED